MEQPKTIVQVYNSLTRQKEQFIPLEPKKINLYVCGVTVYDYCHIGHARTYLAFDVIIRYWRYLGYQINYVRNITDIDDKIIKRAHENGQAWGEVVSRFIDEMHADFDALNMARPDSEPRATQTLPEMISMIQTLIEKGFAYSAQNGDVYYRVGAFKEYGKLSGQSVEQLQAGERVEVNADKENPMDFVLWKAAKPGEPSWPSPWGDGRPGWHLECSCMTKKTLGDQFDVHGGGSDLKFPHHENEIAQSEAANGTSYANYWLHTGMVRVNQEKMSKSLGNFFVIRDVLEAYPAEVVRFFLISGHYRSELNYSDQNLQQAKASLTRLYGALNEANKLPPTKALDESAIAAFKQAMDDDFNVPDAMSVLFGLAHSVQKHKEVNPEAAAVAGHTLKQLGNVLGILIETPETFLKSGQTAIDADYIDDLIRQRAQARQEKNWAKADEIRDELSRMNVVIEDSAGGTTWRVD